VHTVFHWRVLANHDWRTRCSLTLRSLLRFLGTRRRCRCRRSQVMDNAVVVPDVDYVAREMRNAKLRFAV
jgi:hypothetical protein